MTSAAVIGAGISGLVAAYRLRQQLGPHADIVVIDPGPVGGQLQTIDFAGGPFDVGAEGFVRRRPEIAELVDELGLSDRLVSPAGFRPVVWAGGSAHELPVGTLMGLPTSGDSIRGFVSDETVARVDAEPSRPFNWTPGSDCDVASLVGDRFGDEVVARCVDPLLGGVYACTSATAGVRGALGQLAGALDAGAPSLTAAIEQAMGTPRPGPVFGGIDGGYRVLMTALLERTRPRFASVEASSVTRDDGQWVVAPVGTFDYVVVAVRPPVARELVRRSLPVASEALNQIPMASPVVVALELPAETELPELSGVLVATGEALRVKAFTFSDRKWPHLRRPNPVIRSSFGRLGEEHLLDETDDDLVRWALEDLRTVTGIDTGAKSAVVRRWRSALPQYQPGHLDIVRTIEDSIGSESGIAVVGAFLNGVGVPACVGTATRAVERLLA